MTEEIAEGVYWLKGEGMECNSYLLVGEKKILVDTGTGLRFPMLAAKLAKVQCKPAEIDFVVNTHCHFDHSGGNHHFNCPALLHSSDMEAVKNGNANVTCASLFNATIDPLSRAQQIPDTLDGWEVLHTPGHTAGSICLFKNGLLITGDTFFGNDYGYCGRSDLPTGNETQLKETLEFIESLDYKVLMPGHGSIVKK